MAAGSTLIGVLLDRGELPAARAATAALPQPRPTGAIVGLFAVQARLLLAGGRAEEALEQLDRQQAADTARRWLLGIREDNHILRVQALAALGRDGEARALADREIAASTTRGARGAEAIARIARAVLAPDPLPDLEAALTAAREAAMPFVLATALAEYGAALRRSGRRAEAREPLREARDRAHRCGATSLEASVHEELVVAGARPQRLAFSGVDALTASERRVAELAVRGLRNREIAEALFVSLKTVEVHLGRAYTKLGIKGRSQLPEALT
jgi:DNA-binding CsgD family transcriptional regulator